MLTHFIRTKKNIRAAAQVQSPIESLILESIPTDKLAVANDVYENLIYVCRKNEEQVPSYQGATNLLEGLVGRGLVTEIVGIRLERFVDSV